MPFPPIADGAVLLYRLFDVADDIDLGRGERALAGAAERSALRGERPGFLDWPERPLSVSLGAREVALEDGTVLRAAAHVRLFAHGVASVRYEVPLGPRSDASSVATLLRAAADSGALARAARTEAEQVCARLGAALDAPHRDEVFETYAVVLARALADGAAASDVAGSDLACLLLGEPPGTAVSRQTVDDVTRHRFAYTEADLCVLDWDTAFVVEPSGDRSVPDVLEVASAQLLEFRYYDGLFERELLHVTEMLSGPRAGLAWLFLGRYGAVLRRVQNLVVESAEFGERVENAVRVVGDLYLARVYRAAVERFRIPAWQVGARQKAETAAQVAAMLRSEASTLFGHVLESSILALIALEIVMALLR